MAEKPITDNKRRNPRIPTSIDVDYSTYSSYLLRRITNISIGGVFIRTQEILPVGTILDINFKLPEQKQAIATKVKVSWTYRQPPTVTMNTSGMGVQFVEVKDKDLKAIQTFIAKAIKEK